METLKFFKKNNKKNKKESEDSQSSQSWKKLLNQERATLPWLLTPLFHQQLCVHPPQQHQLSQGGRGEIPGRNSPVKIIQAWKQHNLYVKSPASTSDSGNASAGFARIVSTNNVGWSWTVFLRAAHHCYIFSTSRLQLHVASGHCYFNTLWKKYNYIFLSFLL